MPRQAFISIARLARRWRMSRATIQRACEDGRLAGAFRPLGKAWRIPASTVLEHEAAGKTVDKPQKAARVSKEYRELARRYFG